MRRLLVLTGDHSADAHAAGLIAALRERDPAWQIGGVGGVAMAAAGIELISDHRDMNVIGPGGVVKAVPSHWGLARRILAWVDQNKPDVAVVIDYGVFHLWLAPKLRARGVKVLYFIPPQIWASRPWRLKKLRRAADEVLCILPFEQDFYRRNGIPATFVGNPIVARLPAPVSKADLAARHGLDPTRTLIGLFPGSRRMEINQLLHAQIGAARLLEQRFPGRLQFGLSKAQNLKDGFFDQAFARAGGKQLPELKVLEQSHALLSACDVALVKSGTVTLEATLYRTPMIVMYRGPWYAYLLARVLMTVQHISLPNNLAGRRLVPELWQREANATRIADEAATLLDPANHARMQADLATVAAQLADADTPQRVADAVVRLSEGAGSRAMSR
ncbi:MAG TPA: lipid-A-disaccharide synthase [Tepidisphaeraceae bacterium]|nr:lipid-A-disaccharide synthase [Tepidisphaeraceae bacterium]